MSEVENRAHPRRETANGTCCISQDRTFAVDICNLSEGGALIEGEGLALEQGARMRLRLEDFGTFDGTVAWASPGRGGVAFDTLLHSAVVQYVAHRAAIVPGPDDAPRDRFGRALPTPPFPSRFGDILGG